MNHRVPGRICLLGEHCDWAGGASVVVPMDRAIVASASPADELCATAMLEGRELSWREGEDPGALRFVPAVADELHARFGVPRRGRLHIEGDLPPGRGFSSSAATCVAIARALAELHGQVLSREEQAEVAYRAEHDRVGVGCGRLDPIATAQGMPLFLRFEGEIFTVEPLPAHLHLAVGTFRAPRDAAAILSVLGRHFRGEVPLRDYDAVRRVGAVRGALETFAAQAVLGRAALLASDLDALGAAMNACQEAYEEELMPTFAELRAPGLARAVRALTAAGALGAKFSGAGGDGSVVGLFPAARVGVGVEALDALGLEAFAMEVWCAV